jgi:hypothetical protein
MSIQETPAPRTRESALAFIDGGERPPDRGPR